MKHDLTVAAPEDLVVRAEAPSRLEGLCKPQNGDVALA